MADQETTEPETGAEPQKTEVQEPVTDSSQTPDIKAMEKALREANREAEKHRKRLKDIEDRDKSDLEKLTDERNELTQQIPTLQQENMRLRVAMAKKLPSELIDRLRGANEQEMEADADKLLAFLTPTEVSDFDSGPRATADTKKSPEQSHNEDLLRLVGRTPQKQ